ncbi:uncharacterized protein MAM_05494 [Metarhizium album ARSEF 1941]|uniref:RING finger domain-containing protein n=1 Tax=Metarhizium album (strain ARSEF 1941) TaxID=1081103 RepID=A0A0B2WKG5_METAS|nr:uncharacterized protein MAM_05494 [Metarhizium album ARSEF 1941]KHN96551.1 hypothetical protein MAM_05494 [Metarhizium album ARSEF 1941]
MNNLHVNVDNGHGHGDGPPPPYSETDIYSNSGGPRSAASTTSHTGFTPLDDASSTGEVVYTPPLTPRTSSNTHLEPQQPALQPGLTLYFASRPPPANPPSETLTHTLRIESTSLPDDLPYQNDWAARDVTPQDWATFVNFLLPDHTTRGNEALIERRLSVEGTNNATLTSGRFRAEAQLEQAREKADATPRSRSEIEATIQEWNDGFFGPRGMTVRLDSGARMPGAWEAEIEDPEQQRANNCSMFGRLSIGGNGIRYGDAVVLDSNGIKINGLVLNSDGISIGKKSSQPSGTAAAPPQQRNLAGPSGPTSSTGPTGPSWTFGSRAGWDRHRHDSRGPLHGGHDWNHDGHHNWHHGSHGWHDCREAQHSEDRGRRWHPDRKDRHDRSHSASSDSSDSSGSSESSIGSLPDYDDIEDHQLPLYAERLKDWTSRPDQVRTKSDVIALEAELKAVPMAPVDASFDRKALKGQIKGLHSSWKSIKRAQRQARRAYRRERRMQRRAEKREHRSQRREMKRARRDHGRRGGPFHAPPVPPFPPAQAMLPVFPAPPAPPGPTAGPNPPPWTRNWPRCCTGPSQRSSFFFGPDGPLGERGPFGRGAWGGWGRGRGRGRGSGSGSNMPGEPRGPTGRGHAGEVPGSWPQADDESDMASQIPPPGTVTAAKYRAVEEVEGEITKLTVKAAGTKEHRGAMEKEIEALKKKLEALRMEADEAYARELAE